MQKWKSGWRNRRFRRFLCKVSILKLHIIFENKPTYFLFDCSIFCNLIVLNASNMTEYNWQTIDILIKFIISLIYFSVHGIKAISCFVDREISIMWCVLPGKRSTVCSGVLLPKVLTDLLWRMLLVSDKCLCTFNSIYHSTASVLFPFFSKLQGCLLTCDFQIRAAL